MRRHSPWHSLCLLFLLLLPLLTWAQEDGLRARSDNVFLRRDGSPQVHTQAVDVKGGLGTVTRVRIKWNGGSEVWSWKLYKTTQYEDATELANIVQRTGLETTVEYSGYASYVVIEAIDRSGKSLGRSKVFETIPPANLRTEAVIREKIWLQNVGPQKPLPFPRPVATTPLGDQNDWEQLEDNEWVEGGTTSLLNNPVVTFFYGALCSIACVLLWRVRRSIASRSPWLRTLWDFDKADSIQQNKVN